MILAKVVPILLSDARIGAPMEASTCLFMYPRFGGSLALLPRDLRVPEASPAMATW
jgi:hypothetical protein